MFSFKSSFVLAAFTISALAIPVSLADDQLIKSYIVFAQVPAGTQSFTLQNGQDAIALKYVHFQATSILSVLCCHSNQFQSLSASSSCTNGQNACIGSQFAQVCQNLLNNLCI